MLLRPAQRVAEVSLQQAHDVEASAQEGYLAKPFAPAAWLRELPEAGDFSLVAKMAQAVGLASVEHFRNVYAERFGRRPSSPPYSSKP